MGRPTVCEGDFFDYNVGSISLLLPRYCEEAGEKDSGLPPVHVLLYTISDKQLWKYWGNVNKWYFFNTAALYRRFGEEYNTAYDYIKKEDALWRLLW